MEALFLQSVPGEGLMGVFHRPRVRPIGSILYVHPFAEEMNKSRRMAALQARAFADAGWNVLQLDLFGCGDSAGDFGDASWDRWVGDVVFAADWLREQTGFAPALWGLRLGCLLATAALPRLDWRPSLLFWHPVISGRQHLQQFLRLRLAGDILGGKTAGEGGKQLREQLLGGESLEIAGYLLSPGLAQGLDEARLEPVAGGGKLVWLEVNSSADSALSPAAQAASASWKAAGWSVTTAVVAGPGFWQTQEIEELPTLLLAATASNMASDVHELR
jgi:exosortase A-associated hydrolase 2